MTPSVAVQTYSFGSHNRYQQTYDNQRKGWKVKVHRKGWQHGYYAADKRCPNVRLFFEQYVANY